MRNLPWLRGLLWSLAVGVLCLGGCDQGKTKSEKPSDAASKPGIETPTSTSGKTPSTGATPSEDGQLAKSAGTAKPEDVAAARALFDQLGAAAKYTMTRDGVLTRINVSDGSKLSADNIALFGRLTDLQSLHIEDFRDLNDEMVSQLAGLKKLTALGLRNCVIGDPSVELIVASFPQLTDLDLSYNPNLTNSVMKVICQLTGLEKLTLIQTRFNDTGTIHLEKLTNLKTLDIRGNMEASDMTLEIVGLLPNLTSFMHRSTTVGDYGIECLAETKSLKSLLMQDFAITNESGPYLKKIGTLTDLEVFRCQGVSSPGVVALKGMPLTRLKLRDLPAVDDQAMAVFEDLPQLKKLYLHELSSVSDAGLKNLASLKDLEVLDIWSVPQMTDATVDVIATLPKLKELTIRTTGVSDASVDKLLAMPELKVLIFKDNAKVTEAGVQKLAEKKWSKLDTGR